MKLGYLFRTGFIILRYRKNGYIIRFGRWGIYSDEQIRRRARGESEDRIAYELNHEET